MDESSENHPIAAPAPARPPQPGFDFETLLSSQNRAPEAFVAAQQRLLEGMQRLAWQQVTLFSVILQQALDNAWSILQANNPADAADRQAALSRTVMDATLGSMRRVVANVCKCQADAITTFNERLAGDKTTAADACAADCLENSPRPQSGAR